MNQVILTGRLTAKVETKKTQSNKSVASFTVAVSNGKDKPADFINCVAWEKTAELLEKYTNKGNMIGIIGKISTRSYTNRENQKQYITEVLVREVEFLESKPKETNHQFEEVVEIRIDDDDLPF